MLNEIILQKQIDKHQERLTELNNHYDNVDNYLREMWDRLEDDNISDEEYEATQAEYDAIWKHREKLEEVIQCLTDTIECIRNLNQELGTLETLEEELKDVTP